MAKKSEAKKQKPEKSKKKTTHHCSLCNKTGHNARTCGSFREER